MHVHVTGLAAATALLLAGCSADTGVSLPAQREAELLAESRSIVGAYQSELQSALKASLAAGGPVGAIDTCHAVAPAIAERLSAQHGAMVRRTALRARNPDAAPDAFERETMRAWMGAPTTPGGQPAERFQVVKAADGSPEFRYMRAIPMAAKPCSSCHGMAIKPEVETAIAALYPDDRATHFLPGDLRGAFSVRWPLGQKQDSVTGNWRR